MGLFQNDLLQLAIILTTEWSKFSVILFLTTLSSRFLLTDKLWKSSEKKILITYQIKSVCNGLCVYCVMLHLLWSLSDYHCSFRSRVALTIPAEYPHLIQMLHITDWYWSLICGNHLKNKKSTMNITVYPVQFWKKTHSNKLTWSTQKSVVLKISRSMSAPILSILKLLTHTSTGFDLSWISITITLFCSGCVMYINLFLTLTALPHEQSAFTGHKVDNVSPYSGRVLNILKAPVTWKTMKQFLIH